MNRFAIFGLAMTSTLVSAALASGCSGDDPPPPPVDTNTGPVTKFAHDLSAAYCALISECPIPDGDAILRKLLAEGSSSCPAILERTFDISEGYEDLEHAVTAGTVTFNEDAARACIERLGVACVVVEPGEVLSHLCPDVLVGTIAEGGACWRSEECAGDTYCFHGEPARFDCPATCIPRLPLGSVCTSDKECQRVGLTGTSSCLYSMATGTRTCVETRIEAAVGEGMMCGRTGIEPGIQSLVPCARGLFCAGACVAPAEPGAACVGREEPCAGSNLCLDDGAGGFTCQPVTIAHAAGGACGEGANAFCSPYDRLTCGAGGTCELVGDGTAGSACPTDLFAISFCQDGLYCHRDTHVCTAQKELGAMCTLDFECATSACEVNACVERLCI